MPKVLITGVAGFIGSFLGQKALERGYKVIGIDNLFRGKLENIEPMQSNPDFAFYPVDIREANLSEVFRNVDTVFHFAAINGTQHFYEHPLDVLEVNVNGIINILKHAAKHGVKKFVYASSSEVYGEPINFPTNESQPIVLPNIDNPRYSYAASKAIGDFYTRWFANVHGFDYTVLRIFNVYGPRMDSTTYGQVIPEFIRKLLLETEFTVIGNGQQTRSFCYIDDIVEMIMRATGVASNEVLNIGNAHEISILELAKLLHTLEGREFKYRVLPPRLGDTERRVPDTAKAEKLLNYKPQVDIEKGLRLTLDWYKKKWGK